MTLRRPTLQLRCRAGLVTLAAVPALGNGGRANSTLSGLPTLLLLRLADALTPAMVQSDILV